MTTDISTATSTDLMSMIGQQTDLTTQSTAADVSALVKSGEWLPWINLCGSSTAQVKENKIAQGVFALMYSSDNFRDLGKQIDFMSITYRAKAMRLKTPDGKPLSFFDRESAEFKQVQADSSIQNSGCVWGPEFLIWLPAANTFATFMCGNPTMRRAAPDLFSIMKDPASPDENPIYVPSPASAITDLIKGTSNIWWGAIFQKHSTPLPAPSIDNFLQVMKDQMEKFRNPPKSRIEVTQAPTAGTGTTRAR